MANQRVDGVRYQKLRVPAVLAEGLIGVDRDNGDPQRRVAAAFGRIAEEAGQFGDRAAAAEGKAAGLAAGLAGAPGAATISGGVEPGSVGGGADPMGYAPTSVRPAGGTGDLNTRGARIRDKLVQRGLTPMMAAAAVGHARQESSLNPAGPDGDKGTSSGLFQWRNERRTALQSFAGKRNWRDEDVQLDFFVHELKTRERTAWQGLQGAKTLEEATAALMHFERPQGYTIRNPRGGHGWGNRLANAQWAAGLAGASDAAPIEMVTALAPEPPKTGAAAAIEKQITPQSVAPPSVTPISVERGTPGGFRPTGSLTIRGQAYDAAGTRTYLEQLDATMRTDMGAVYERFKDDPVRLQEGFDALRTLQRDDHVFPEIAGDYEAAFARMREPYQRQAWAEQEKRTLVANRADFLQRTQDLETEKARAIAIFDGTEEGAGALSSIQTSIDGHYDSAVARGVLDADDAVLAKAQSRREAALGFYGKQADRLTTPEEIAAYREQLRADFAANDLPGLDGEGWQTLDAALDKAVANRRTSDTAAQKALTERGEALADAVLKGASPSSPEISRFMLDAKTAPGGEGIVQTSLQRIQTAQRLRDMPIAKSETMVRELERSPDAQSSGLADFARGAFDDLKKNIETDPLGAAINRGLLPDQPAIFDAGGDAGAVAGRLKARVIAAETAAEHFGVSPTYLRPGEAEALRKLGRADPDAAATIAGGLIRGAGTRVNQVLAELGSDAPSIVQAGMIIAGGGSARAARDVVAGYARGDNGEDRPQIPVAVRAPVIQEAYGDAFAGSPGDGETIEAAGHAIARTRVSEAGVDPKSPEAGAIYAQALQEAAGAVTVKGVQFGGIADISYGSEWPWPIGSSATVKVMVPPSIRADRFGDVIDAIRDGDLAPVSKDRGPIKPAFRSPPVDAGGKAYKASDLKAARPVAVNGGYRFAFGDPASDDPQWVRGADGLPFVLAIERLRDQLEARVPGAFR